MFGEKVENKGKHTAFREEMEVNGDNGIVAYYGMPGWLIQGDSRQEVRKVQGLNAQDFGFYFQWSREPLKK